MIALGIDPAPYGKPMGLALVEVSNGIHRYRGGVLCVAGDDTDLRAAVSITGTGPLPNDAPVVCECPIPAWSGASTALSGGEVWRCIGWVDGVLGRGPSELILGVSARSVFGLAREKRIGRIREVAERLFDHPLPSRGKARVHESIVNAAITAAGWLTRKAETPQPGVSNG